MRYKVYSGSTSEPVATFTPGTTSITLANVGDKVIFYGSNTATASGSTAYWSFNMTGRIAASGSITTLIEEGREADYTCTFLFKDCTALTSAPELPSTTVKKYGYSGMFQGCTSLTTAPELPAETLANYCYAQMFYGCSSLTSAPELPATSLAQFCYYYMFRDCTSLATVPQELPATTLFASSYAYMFYGCTALATAPKLPATTLEASSYRYMFYGCTSLVTPPPTLPATALEGTFIYQYMFYGCSNLEKAPVICLTTAPTIRSVLAYMFYNCSKLKEIEIHLTSWPTRTTVTTNWVKGVAATGTFKCPAALGTDSTITRGTGNCPTGWTVVNI
jgi:hypothetical protein